MKPFYSARMNEIEAINILLSAIGASPVVKIENPQNVDAINARSALLQAVREIQLERWYFNVEDNFPLVPDEHFHEIIIPSNIINIDYIGRFAERPQYAIRGQRLYDLSRHTYKFETTIYANVHLSLEFDELPETAKQYAVTRAARKFQETMLGDPNLRTWTSGDEAMARAKLLDEELRARKSYFGLFAKDDPSVIMDLRDHN